MTEETLVEKIKIYEVTWGRYTESDRVSTNSEGYYLNQADAKKALKEIKASEGELSFQSGEIIPKSVIRVGNKIYKIRFEYQIPKTFDDPSQLEKLTKDSANLNLGNGLIVTIGTQPLEKN